MKKQIFILIILILLMNLSTAFAATPPISLTAPAAILLDADTGQVLYEKNAHQQMFPASTTKMMTAILTLENSKLTDKVIIDDSTPFTEGSRIYVIEGEEFTVEQLLKAMLIESANDCAVALAKHVSKDVDSFVKLMNKRAKELGAKNTHFVNPNGLTNDNHLTTAYDLAMIAKHAMTIPEFKEIVKMVRYQIPPTNKQTETRYFKNTNKFLWGVGGKYKIPYKGKWIDIKYDLIDGVKTGYTSVAKHCLVSSGQKNGHRLISVVLKTDPTNVYVDSRTLIDYGFDHFSFLKLTEANKKMNTIPIKNGVVKELDLLTQNKLYKSVNKSENISKIKPSIHMKDSIQAPIQKGQVLGQVVYDLDGKSIGKVDLIAATSIEKEQWLVGLFGWALPSDTNFNQFFRYIFYIFLAYLIYRTIITTLRLKKRKKRLMKKKKYKGYIQPSSLKKIRKKR